MCVWPKILGDLGRLAVTITNTLQGRWQIQATKWLSCQYEQVFGPPPKKKFGTNNEASCIKKDEEEDKDEDEDKKEDSLLTS